jgi:hypothetical protein
MSLLLVLILIALLTLFVVMAVTFAAMEGRRRIGLRRQRRGQTPPSA